MSNVPIPKLMQKLEKDSRGYPIPAGVFRDQEGKPHFTVNAIKARIKHLNEKRCPICNHRLTKGYWFVGGPASAFHEQGAYLDLPMHHECMQYAMQVCPYLAAPKYSGRIDGGTLKDHNGVLVLVGETMYPERPALFVCVCTRNYKLLGASISGHLRPFKPYRKVEFWRYGKQLERDEGYTFASEALKRQFGLPQNIRIFTR